MKKVFLFIVVAVSLFTFNACQKDSSFVSADTQTPSPEELAKVVKSFSDSFNLNGLIRVDKATFDTYPKADLKDYPNRDNALNLRAAAYNLATPYVATQGQEGSCAAFAIGYVGVSQLLYKKHGLAYNTAGAYRSPEFLYNMTKTSNNCINAGTNMANALNFLKTYGVCSWAQMPYSATNGCSLRPTTTQIQQAQVGRINSWGYVPNNVNSIKSYISNGYPVMFGFDVDEMFLYQTGRSPFTYTQKGGAYKGGHAVAIIGYDDNRQVFKVQNSWGLTTHDNGFFYISYNLMPSLGYELYVMN